MHTGKLSHRRLRIILDHLPPESRFKTALYESQTPEQRAAHAADDDDGPVSYGPWSMDQHLLARIGDSLDALVWMKQAKKGDKPPRPLPRPGVEAEVRRPVRKSTVEYLQRIRDDHAKRREGASE